MIWRQRDLSVQDDRKRRQSAATRHSNNEDVGRKRSDFGKYTKNINVATHRTSNRASQSTARRGEIFKWECAMSMMGGWKLSLT